MFGKLGWFLRHLRHVLLAANWVLPTGWDIRRSILLFLLFLNQINACEHDSFLVGILLVRLSPETSLCRFLYYGSAALSATCATFCRIYPSRCRIRDDLSYILARVYGGSSELLTGAGSRDSAFLSGGTSTALSFVHRNAAAPNLAAGGKKAFSCVAFPEKLFVLFAELVPKVMEKLIVGPMDDVA